MHLLMNMDAIQYHNSNIDALYNGRNNYFSVFNSFTIQSRYLSLIMSATMSLGSIVARAVFDSAVLALLPGLLQKYTYTLYTNCLVSAGSSTLESSLASTPLPLQSLLQLNMVHAVIASAPYCAVLPFKCVESFCEADCV